MALLATINPLNQFFALSGSPLNNGKLYFGSVNADPEQNPVQMYWDSAGLVPALQPIRTTSGYPSRTGSPAILYCAVEYSLRVRQSNDVEVFYLARAGSASLQTFGQWAPSNVTPSYASANSFTLTGDQTAEFKPKRRLRFQVTTGTVYGTISTAVYGALTTVTMIMDGASVLDSGLSSVDLSILTPDNSAVPTNIARVVTSMVRLRTANGVGSTNTAIRRLTTVVLNQGSDITYADSATLGATFTIVNAGMYAVSATDSYNGSNYLGFSLNSTQLTTGIASITPIDRLNVNTTTAANQPVSCAWAGYLSAGDVIRMHVSASVTTGADTGLTCFSIARMN